MQRESDDEAWRAIVENYGERPTLDQDAGRGDLAGTVGDPAGPGDARGPSDLPDLDHDRDDDLEDDLDEPRPGRDPDDGFTPPNPPPLPVPPPDRLVAWLGVFGAPVVLLVSLLAGAALPSWAAYLLVAWFVGGFGYLVVKMPREPRDPWDDGAQV